MLNTRRQYYRIKGNWEHEKKINEGIEIWNAWRRENPDVKPNLNRAELRKANLSGANLSGVTLFEADLREANLSGSDLSNANLMKADLGEADLRDANLQKTNLHEADLWDAQLEGVILTGAILSKADLRSTILLGANLQGFDLHEANLSGAYLDDADLRGANLGGAYLIGTDLSGANLSDAILISADLSKANLRRASLKRTILAGADLSDTNLAKTDFSKAELLETHFINVNLTDTLGLGTCVIKGELIIDHKTLENSKDIPLNFLREAGLSEERLLAYSNKDHLTITFTKGRWGHLTPIEAALTAKLGDGYIVEKSEDKIIVKLNSSQQFTAAADAVLPVLAAIHKTLPGTVKTLEATESGEEPILIDDLQNKLTDLIRLLEGRQNLKASNQSDLANHEKMIVAMVDGGVRKVAAKALEAWFRSGNKISEKIIDPVSWAIYKNYLEIISRLKNTIAMGLSKRVEESPRDAE